MMTLTPWQAFPEISTLQSQLNRLFEDMLTPYWQDKENMLGSPAVELSETEQDIHLKLEIPGINPEDLDIQVSKETVFISGERKQESKTEENGITRSEFRYGKFQRVISLPAYVENTNVTAEYKEGILNIVLPKTDEEKNKAVKVQVS